MTEDEAKTKWCPLVRHVPATESHHAFDNREMPIGNPSARCIASACMAWRWDEPWTSQTEEGHGGDLVVRLKRKTGEPKLGFCGLAGAPR